MADDKPFISIIIPAYNAQALIAGCIESLLIQDYPQNKYEVIIVDNNSQDRTQEVIKRYPVQLFICHKRGSYVARNLGARHARGEILAFTDADCVASRDWLSVIADTFKQNNVAALQGPGNKTLQKSLRVKVECLTRVMKERFWGDTKNFAIRKKIFIEAGGFNNFFTGSDALFLRTLQSKKLNVKFNENMVVFHTFPTNLLILIKKNWKHGIGDLFLAKKSSKLNRTLKLKELILYNFENSLRIIPDNYGLLDKIYMRIYYLMTREIRCLSYIIHSFLPKVFLDDKDSQNI